MHSLAQIAKKITKKTVSRILCLQFLAKRDLNVYFFAAAFGLALRAFLRLPYEPMASFPFFDFLSPFPMNCFLCVLAKVIVLM